MTIFAHFRCYKYTVSTDKWRRLPDMPNTRSGMAAVATTQYLFVTGGADRKEKPLSLCEALNLKNEKWESRPRMLQAMLLPIMAATDANLYVAFNTHHENRKSRKGKEISMQNFSLATKKWSFVSAMPAEVQDTLGAGAVGVEKCVYVVGGWDRLCAKYDTSADVWTLMTKCDLVHVYHSAAYYQGRITMFGGADANGASNDIEEYDVEENKWRLRTLELPEPVQSHSSMVLFV